MANPGVNTKILLYSKRAKLSLKTIISLAVVYFHASCADHKSGKNFSRTKGSEKEHQSITFKKVFDNNFLNVSREIRCVY